MNDDAVNAQIQAAPTGASELYNNATGGTFTITATVGGNKETTDPINYHASASAVQSAVQTALNKLTGVTATVTGSGTAADPWIISGTGLSALSTTDSLTPTGAKSTLAAVPSNGQQMSIGSGSGALIIQMVAGGDVQSAILPANATAAQLQAALDGMDPSVQAIVTGEGTALDPWLISGTNVSAISTVPFGLSGGSSTFNAVPQGAQQLFNNAGGGTFQITATVNGQSETATLAYNVSAASLASALPGVTVTGLGTAADPWLISGASAIAVNGSGLTGNSTVQSVGFLPQALWNNATGGTFTISADVNGTTETTGSLNYNASASVVQAALNTLASVSVTVIGSGTASDPWVIIGTGISSLAATDSLSGGNSTIQAVPATAQELWNTATGGDLTFQMTAGGQLRTAIVAYNASAAQVQAALDGMDPSVQAHVTGTGTASDPWLISGTGVSAVSIVVPFGLVETTGPLAYNVSASTVQAALNALAGVSVTVTGSGTASDPWLIRGTWVSTVSVDQSALVGGSATVAAAPGGACNCGSPPPAARLR